MSDVVPMVGLRMMRCGDPILDSSRPWLLEQTREHEIWTEASALARADRILWLQTFIVCTPTFRSTVLPNLIRLVTQQALFETRASLAGLAHMSADRAAPGSVFLGLGLSNHCELSLCLPFDTLGMLFAAEQARRALGVRQTLVLIADEHASCNGHDRRLVARTTLAHERLLQRIVSRLGWNHVRLVRACELHALDAHAKLHEDVRRAAPEDTHPYVTREIADIEYFSRISGGLLKVGWALGAQAKGWDERAFDERYQRWIGGNVGFVYCKAGRTLDDRRRKAVPYLVRDPSRRVCLAPGERIREKLERASAYASVSTLRGVKKHMKAITRSYKQLVRPLCGPIEDQAQMLLAHVLGSEAAK